MLTHAFAFERIHVSCILVRCINMHSPALHLLHHNAFSIWCIYMHYHASIIRCICILCCIIMHLVHVMHSCALPYACILNVMHTNAFGCMQMRCIQMHSNYDAFMCITVFMHSERDAYKCILMHANALHSDAFRLSRGRRAKRGEKESKRHHGSTQQQNQTSTYPLIPHREFPTVVTD